MIRNNGMRLFAGLLLGLFYSLSIAQTGQAVEGSAKADKLESCVRDTPFMRRNHFELIKHQRDVTVHEGIRKTEDSLAGCVDCHVRRDAEGQPVAINAPGEFCASCHTYAAVTLDCFSCHATVPTGKNAMLKPEVEVKLGDMDPDVIKQAHAGLNASAQATDSTPVTGK